MYAIETDRRRNLVTIRLGGMMSIPETVVYMAELRNRFVRERFRDGFRLLVDVSDCKIQSQETIKAMRDHMTGCPKASRIAMVTDSSLARMQIKRLMTQSYLAIFASCDEALAWLDSEPVAA